MMLGCLRLLPPTKLLSMREPPRNSKLVYYSQAFLPRPLFSLYQQEHRHRCRPARLCQQEHSLDHGGSRAAAS